MPVSRRDAVAAALRVLDETGLEGVSLRRVAAELGVAAPTLYWHVRDKRELLDLVAEAIVAQNAPLTEPRPGQPWWEWLHERTLAVYRGMLAVRDSARLMAGNRPTEDAYEPLNRMIGALASAGVAPADALRMLFVLGAYVMGSVLERQAEESRATVPAEPPFGWDDDRYPYLAAAVRGARIPPGSDPRDAEAVFRFGLERLVEGLRAWQARQLEERTDRSAAEPAGRHE